MLKKITKVIIRLGLVLTALVWLSFSHSPTLAQPQPPPNFAESPAPGLPEAPAEDQPAEAAAPAAQAVTINLCAAEATATMPDGAVVPIWGYGQFTGAGCLVQLPGPVLRVNAGATVTVSLINFLPVPTSILFLGQAATSTGGVGGLFTQEAAAGGTVNYTFTAGEPGTYLYESGTVDQPQAAMGLYGALIVDPATPNQAYADASTAYDVEAVIVLSEIDPNLNADPAGFDLTDYRPTYWLMNGRAYPDTLNPDDSTTQPYSSLIDAAAGDRVLVRYLNAGAIHHTISSLNQYQRVIARDADEMDPVTQQFEVVAQTIPSGQTTDMIIDIVAEGSFPLFNRQLHITNGAPGPDHFIPGGGMMTFMEIGP